ncbi:DUF4326 domain-containing protein [Streptomyces sp. NPDC054770]
MNVRGRIHEFGPRLEHAPADVVHVGRRWTMGGWDLPRHPLYNPFACGKTLACWCAPEPCHADVLAELAELPQP